jgi:hypothetical protein
MRFRSRMCSACGNEITGRMARADVRFRRLHAASHFHRACWALIERSVETAPVSIRYTSGWGPLLYGPPDDEGGAGVREPRRPLPPTPQAGAAALDLDDT